MGTNFTIGNPGHLTLDAAGNVYFVSLNCAFKLDTTGVLTRLAGTGAGGYSGDGGAATSARLSAPRGIAVDVSGNLYIAVGYRQFPYPQSNPRRNYHDHRGNRYGRLLRGQRTRGERSN